jgi:predicted RNA-binding protein
MDYELIDTLKQVLQSKIKKIRNDMHYELHNKAYNDSLQNEIHNLEWVLEYIMGQINLSKTHKESNPAFSASFAR